MSSGKSKSQASADTIETVNCHVRFPEPVYKWLRDKAAPKHRTVQKQVIELVLAAQEAESREEEQAA